MKIQEMTYEKGAELIRRGSVGVIPTDTLYGIVCRFDMPVSVDRLYRLKRREKSKPCIILIDCIERLIDFGVTLSESESKTVRDLWPGPVSIIFDVDESFKDLTCGTDTLAFRVPLDERLRSFLTVSGPVLAPSANLEGMKPPITVSEAYLYFGEEVDFYVDDDRRDGPASRVIRLKEDREVIFR